MVTADRQRLEFLLSATSAVTYSCDVHPPFAATFVSENLFTVLGYTARQLVETPEFWAAHIHPEDRDHVLGGVGKIFTDGRLAHEYRLLHANGTYRWVHDELVLVRDESGAPVEMVGVFYDVTTRKEAERARERSERSFQALIDVLPVGVMIHRDRRIVYANRAMRALLRRYADEDIIGLSALVVALPSSHPRVEERIRLLEAAPELTINAAIEQEFVRLDGTHVFAEVEAMKLDFAGAPSILVLARDLSERRAMLAQLAASDRLASMGTLAAGVAHEINNPLTYILTNLSLLAESLPELIDRSGAPPAKKAQMEALVHDAYEGASRVRDVVRDLRSLSRRDVDDVFPIDVRQVLESCMRIAANEIKHTARLTLDLGDVPLVHASPTRLGQVFLNLILNATQAFAADDPHANELRVRTSTSPDGAAVVEVSDNGPGIAPEIVPHVFDPFFTTKPVGAGTGLGLSICHGIVTAMHGTITVDSAIGRGTTFRVTLPVGQPRAAKAEPPRASGVARRARVLVIDDERPIVSMLRFVLEPHHDVIGVTRAQEALELLARGEVFDVILCDVMMPEVGGIKFYEQIDASLKERVVFLTGGAFTQAAREFLRRVPNTTLEKPFEPQTLLAIVARVLGR